MTAVTTHDLNVVHVLVCIDHELIEVHVVGEAMLSDSLSHLQEHFVLLGCAKLLIRTNVEVVARDTLGRVVLLFAFLSTILSIVNEVVVVLASLAPTLGSSSPPLFFGKSILLQVP